MKHTYDAVPYLILSLVSLLLGVANVTDPTFHLGSLEHKKKVLFLVFEWIHFKEGMGWEIQSEVKPQI